jgi:hypothetical protein
MLKVSLAAIAALGLAACATADDQGEATPSGNDCFFASQVNAYEVVDANSVRVRVSANRHYLLRTAWNTSDLNWTQAIALRSTTGHICTGNGLGVQVIGGDPQRTYPITSIERIPDDIPPDS